MYFFSYFIINNLFCSYTNNYSNVLFIFKVYIFTNYTFNFTSTIVTNSIYLLCQRTIDFWYTVLMIFQPLYFHYIFKHALLLEDPQSKKYRRENISWSYHKSFLKSFPYRGLVKYFAIMIWMWKYSIVISFFLNMLFTKN